jgi:hypothetical protein
MKRSRWLEGALTLLALGTAVSCSTLLGFEELTVDESDGGVSDGSADGQPDGQPDAQPDGQPDAQPDVNPDAQPDVNPDAQPDVNPDALPDVQPDVQPDAQPDGQPDVVDAPEEEVGCGDTQTDPDNCGRCGHGCAGGVCVDGMCKPYKLATVWDGSWGMAVGETDVCVAIQLNNLMTCVNKTSGVLQWTGDNLAVTQPSWVAMDETNVYWSNRVSTSGSIGVCKIAGCTTPAKLIEPANRPNGIAVDATHVYWAETNGKTLKRAGKDGTGIEVIVSESLNFSPFLLALHGGYVYFSERAAGRVARVPRAGGAVQVLGSSPAPSKVAVTQDWVFWTDSGSIGTIHRVPNADPPDGGSASTLFASAQTGAFGIVADEQYVYWIASAESGAAEGALRACAITGCQGSPIGLDEGLAYPIDVVMDDTALYYSIFGIDTAIDGEIRKVAKL